MLVDIEADQPLLALEGALGACTDRTRAVIVVHLYGITADARRFVDAFAERGIPVVEDCAEAQGAQLPTGEPAGSVGAFGAMSFYPTKNLARSGDGGAVVTSDAALANEVRAWRSHGERAERYLHELPARNSRLDDIQAAVLRIRLVSLGQEVDRRRAAQPPLRGSIRREGRLRRSRGERRARSRRGPGTVRRRWRRGFGITASIAAGTIPAASLTSRCSPRFLPRERRTLASGLGPVSRCHCTAVSATTTSTA